MKKLLLTLTTAVISLTDFAQGTITFYNNNIIDPTTGAAYTAGIWADDSHTVGAGSLPGGVTVGLFLADDLTTPVATIVLRTTTRQEVFAATQDVTIPGTIPNVPANLVIRAWSTGAGSFAAAQADFRWQWGEQAFTSKPLGGVNPNPPPPSFTAPDIAPFTGFSMEHAVPEPSIIALSILGIGALSLSRRRR
jgi:hypothetical protein